MGFLRPEFVRRPLQDEPHVIAQQGTPIDPVDAKPTPGFVNEIDPDISVAMAASPGFNPRHAANAAPRRHETLVMDDIVIVGAGPSGLTAAREAASHGARTIVVEQLDQVGGLARTIEFGGSRFDIGPHRFFTKNREVHELYARILGDERVKVSRLTRILHDRRYFNYPLTPANAVFGIGPIEGMAIAVSYAAARLRAAVAPRPTDNFEDWIVDRFGRRLYQHFFKSYTEKVWGISCRQIGADWASQRIRGLDLSTALRNALWSSKGSTPKTLVDEFSYPRLGAGQAYELMAATHVQSGNALLTGSTVGAIRRDGGCVRAIVTTDRNGQERTIEGRYFLVSAPLTRVIEMMQPGPPVEVLDASRALRYRAHIAVNLLVEGPCFADNWIYVHDNSVAMARIANYRNFSSAMAGAPGISPITVEYFAFPGDRLSLSSDAELIARATMELSRIGVITPDQARDGFVVRSPEAYPVIEKGYEMHLGRIKQWIDQFENLLPIGRSGMFKYNNQDHAMATGMLAARTALGLQRFDPWLVNIDGEYHESAPSR